MFEEYRALAYRKAIWEKLGALLKDYFPEDLGEANVITCDDVPYKDRKVTREAIEDVLEELAGITKEAEKQMASFDMVRKDDAGKRIGPTRKESGPTRRVRKSPRRKA